MSIVIRQVRDSIRKLPVGKEEMMKYIEDTASTCVDSAIKEHGTEYDTRPLFISYSYNYFVGLNGPVGPVQEAIRNFSDDELDIHRQEDCSKEREEADIMGRFIQSVAYKLGKEYKELIEKVTFNKFTDKCMQEEYERRQRVYNLNEASLCSLYQRILAGEPKLCYNVKRKSGKVMQVSSFSFSIPSTLIDFANKLIKDLPLRKHDGKWGHWSSRETYDSCSAKAARILYENGFEFSNSVRVSYVGSNKNAIYEAKILTPVD